MSNNSPMKDDPDGVRLLDKEEMANELNEILEEGSSLLNIPVEAANALMRHYKFNKERLIEHFYGDSEKVSRDAGVLARCGCDNLPQSQKKIAISKKSPTSTYCR